MHCRKQGRWRVASLQQNVLDYLSVYVGQAEVSPRVSVRQAFVVQAHEVQDGRMEVVDVGSIFDGSQPKYIGSAIAETGFDSATGHPDRETVVIVVTPFLAFGSRGSAKFSSPQDQRLVEQSALFKIREQRGNSLVAGIRQAFVTACDVVVPGIPGDIVAIDRMR